MRNQMRNMVLVLLFVVAVMLAGCNPGISSDAAAKAFIDALFSGNVSAARDTLCERAKPLLGDDAAAVLGEMAQTQIDTSGLSYSVRDATDTTANVAVSGNVRIGTGEAQQEVDFATVAQSLALLPAVVENSAWKVCPASLGLEAG